MGDITQATEIETEAGQELAFVSKSEPKPDPEPAPAAHAASQPVAAVSAKTAALAELRAWVATHCRDSAISRDTHALNVIHNAVATIEAAIGAVKE